MQWKKFFGMAKEVIVRTFFYTNVWLSIICLAIALILLAVAGFSAEGVFNAFHNHPVWVVIAIILSQIITTTLPSSITGFIVPEPVVSKIGGVLGISGSSLTAIVLFIMMLFISGLGTIIFTIMAIVFMFFSILSRRHTTIKSSLLFKAAGVMTIVIGIIFLITVFVSSIFSLSAVLGCIGILISAVLIGMGILVFFLDRKHK